MALCRPAACRRAFISRAEKSCMPCARTFRSAVPGAPSNISSRTSIQAIPVKRLTFYPVFWLFYGTFPALHAPVVMDYFFHALRKIVFVCIPSNTCSNYPGSARHEITLSLWQLLFQMERLKSFYACLLRRVWREGFRLYACRFGRQVF